MTTLHIFNMFQEQQEKAIISVPFFGVHQPPTEINGSLKESPVEPFLEEAWNFRTTEDQNKTRFKFLHLPLSKLYKYS